MTPTFTRRQFLEAGGAAAGLALAPTWARAASPDHGFSFVLLGDLHYDKLEHHDMAYLDKKYPNDLGQIQNYTRITREIMPRLFATVRDTVAGLKPSPTPPAFVLQVGDLVEGLCGSEALAVQQDEEALGFVRASNLGVPFLFAKGNHDVTGDGAVAAFGRVFHPFLSAQVRALTPAAEAVTSARYTVDHGNAQFAFFDAYDSGSLDWFEAVAAKRTAEHFFVTIHPPVVPYGARSTWPIFSNAKDKVKRDKLLDLLGNQRALVLGGHIHKFNSLVRTTDHGRFAQLALSSVVSGPTVKAKDLLSGLGEYTGDQIRVEPNFSPSNAAERRAIYDAERPFVKAFEYADLPGYAVVTVRGSRVSASMYAGIGRELWRTVDLSGMMLAAG